MLVASDNVQDPFCPIGSFDPLEALSAGVMAAQLPSPFDVWSESLCRSDWLARNSGHNSQKPLQMGSDANLLIFKTADVWGFPSRTHSRVVMQRGRLTHGTAAEEWTDP